MTRVFPEPGPASTRQAPSRCSTAARWSGSRTTPVTATTGDGSAAHLAVVVVGDLLPARCVHLAGQRRVAVEVADRAGLAVAVLAGADHRARGEAHPRPVAGGVGALRAHRLLVGVEVIGDLLPARRVDPAGERRV